MKYLKIYDNFEECSYWHVDYISCEGNERWTIARTPIDWEEWQVLDRIHNMRGSCGDDPAEIVSVFQTNDDEWSWDFTD